MSGVDRTLFAALLREEWRLHARLFGGGRLAPLPAVVAALCACTVVGASAAGADADTLVVGGHALALGFGLYAGTAGFVGGDLLEHALGEVTLLLSSSATLPVSRRRLLALFLLEDAAFYAVCFLLPLAVGFAPLVALGALPLGDALLLWPSLLTAFALGTAATFGLIAARTRGWSRPALGALVAVVVAGAWVGRGTVGALLVPVGGGPRGWPLGVGLAVAAGSAALAGYDSTHRRPVRATPARLDGLARRIPGSGGDLAAKSILDVARSSGGLWKPLVSVALLGGVAAGLLGIVDSAIGVRPAPGLFFGPVLGLSAFTTYNWLTQFDDVDSYLPQPVSVGDLVRAKRTAFVLLGVPSATLGYGAVAAAFGAGPADALLGFVLLVGTAVYFFGLTVALAGFDPNAFLFDAVRFAAFFAGVAVPLLPILLVAFAVDPARATLPPLFAIGAAGVAFVGAGAWLSERAVGRWERYYATR